MVQTDNEFQMLMSRLERIENNQNKMDEKLARLIESDSALAQRVAKLEEFRARCVTYKQMLTWAIGSAGVAGTVSHFATRFIGGG